MMPEIRRNEYELEAEDLAAKAARGRTAMADWIEGRHRASAAGPRLVQHEVRSGPAWDVEPAPLSMTGGGGPGGAAGPPLLPEAEISELRARWSNIQTDFVDEPRRAVREADQLVAAAIQRLAEGFARERASLDRQWDQEDDTSTEELRLAFQRYRAFFGRLLNVT